MLGKHRFEHGFGEVLLGVPRDATHDVVAPSVQTATLGSKRRGAKRDVVPLARKGADVPFWLRQAGPLSVSRLKISVVALTAVTTVANAGAYPILLHVVLLDTTIRIGRRLVGARRHETTRALAAG